MNEIPMINATMWTHTDLRDKKIIEKLKQLFVMRKDDLKPKIIYGGKLTSNKNKKFNNENEEDIKLFYNCLSNKDVLRIVLTNDDRIKEKIIFAFTIAFVPQFTVITFEATHTFFSSQEQKDKYMSIVKELIEIVDPIYAKIDDIGNSLDILEKYGEETYQCVINYVPAIFWGNYFGQKYVTQYGREKLLNSPYGIVSIVGNGILITTTNDPMNYNSKECAVNRKKLSKYLNISRQNLIKKLFRL